MRDLLTVTRKKRFARRASAAIGLIVLAAACENGVTGAGSGGRTLSIDVRDNYYTVTPDTVAVGASVTWTWRGGESHSVTFAAGSSSATQNTGTFTRSFVAPGTYAYHCVVHGLAMSGVIVAQ